MLPTSFLLFFALAGQHPGRPNGAFEAAKSTVEWTVTPAGLPAGIEIHADDQVHHDGRQSLETSAGGAPVLDLQINRFWGWANEKQMLEEPRAAGTRIKNYDDWSRKMFDRGTTLRVKPAFQCLLDISKR